MNKHSKPNLLIKLGGFLFYTGSCKIYRRFDFLKDCPAEVMQNLEHRVDVHISFIIIPCYVLKVQFVISYISLNFL